MPEQRALVEISDEGVMLYGRSIGNEPSFEDVLKAVPYEPDRRFAKMDNTRELLVFDAIGLCVLREIASDLVYALVWHFERPDWRNVDNQDPNQYFRGRMRVGNVTFIPPIRRKVAEKASEQTFSNLSFFFTCQEQGVAGCTIGFPLNEGKIDPELDVPNP
jgi:hypothetical protein